MISPENPNKFALITYVDDGIFPNRFRFLSLKPLFESDLNDPKFLNSIMKGTLHVLGHDFDSWSEAEVIPNRYGHFSYYYMGSGVDDVTVFMLNFDSFLQKLRSMVKNDECILSSRSVSGKDFNIFQYIAKTSDYEELDEKTAMKSLGILPPDESEMERLKSLGSRDIIVKLGRRQFGRRMEMSQEWTELIYQKFFLILDTRIRKSLPPTSTDRKKELSSPMISPSNPYKFVLITYSVDEHEPNMFMFLSLDRVSEKDLDDPDFVESIRKKTLHVLDCRVDSWACVNTIPNKYGHPSYHYVGPGGDEPRVISMKFENFIEELRHFIRNTGYNILTQVTKDGESFSLFQYMSYGPPNTDQYEYHECCTLSDAMKIAEMLGIDTEGSLDNSRDSYASILCFLGHRQFVREEDSTGISEWNSLIADRFRLVH